MRARASTKPAALTTTTKCSYMHSCSGIVCPIKQYYKGTAEVSVKIVMVDSIVLSHRRLYLDIMLAASGLLGRNVLPTAQQKNQVVLVITLHCLVQQLLHGKVRSSCAPRNRVEYIMPQRQSPEGAVQSSKKHPCQSCLPTETLERITLRQ